ncbi:hypothetical protein GCM10009718_29030 [Isoptericola halotolerans]|uniref:Type I restriction enzyme S subunit n=1 Tax=Isoptericola halotolerans TaxID=300560 RepID=A0ABX2A819_9MICO|nr:type I restriction enzyme S subunit [Isoptericola halotolerans]
MIEVPAGWSSAPLGDVCKVVSGGTPKTAVDRFWGGEVPWITPADMSRDRSQVLYSGARSLSDEGYRSCGATLVPEGSVVVSSRAPVGYVAIAGQELSTNQGCKTAVPPSGIDSKYLYWFLVAAKPDLEARASGTTFKEISAKRFAETRLWWPEPSEQERIVEILEDHLSRLDAGVDYLHAVHKRANSLRQAYRQSALDEFGAELVPLGDLVAKVEAGRSLGGAAPPAAADEWGIIKVSAMTWGEFRPNENKLIPAEKANARYEILPGDLLVSRANTSAYVGASVLVKEARPRLLLSDKSLRLMPAPGVSAEWLHEVLQAPGSRDQISRLATGTKDSMRNISQKALLSIQVPVMDEDAQTAVVERCARSAEMVGTVVDAVDRELRRADRLRRSLLIAAFSGRMTGASSDVDRVEELAEAMA